MVLHRHGELQVRVWVHGLVGAIAQGSQCGRPVGCVVGWLDGRCGWLPTAWGFGGGGWGGELPLHRVGMAGEPVAQGILIRGGWWGLAAGQLLQLRHLMHNGWL